MAHLAWGERGAMPWRSALYVTGGGGHFSDSETEAPLPRGGTRTAAVVALLLSLVSHSTRTRGEDTARGEGVPVGSHSGTVPRLVEMRRARPGRVPHPFVVLNITCWTPPTAQRRAGVVVFVHGLNGHSTFADSAALALHLCRSNSYTVYGLDVEGHGRSGGVRGLTPDLHRQVAADIVAALFAARRDNPGLPLFLVGISMGGCAALHAALALQDAGLEACLSGLVLLCPLIRPLRTPARTLTTAAHVLAKLPVLARLPLPAQHSPGDGCSDESAKAAMRHAMCADGHIHTGGLRVGTAVALLAAARVARRRMHELSGVPLLVQHGTADAVVSLAGSEELFAAAGVADKTLLTYLGAGHALLGECPAAVGDLTSWMARRSRAACTDTVHPV